MSDESFSVLLAYAHFTNEPVSQLYFHLTPSTTSLLALSATLNNLASRDKTDHNQLVAKHAAAAAGMAERTAYSRISKAKTDFSIILNEDKPAEKSAGSPKTPGIEVFKVLIKYTEAAGTNVSMPCFPP